MSYSHRDPSRHITGGILLILLGVLFLLDNMNILDFGEVISTYWPIILILYGFRLLFKKSVKIMNATVSIGAPQIASSAKFSADFFNQNKFFGNIRAQIKSSRFKGGAVTLLIGDIYLDLTDIKLAEGQQTLNVSCFIGDVQIIFPRDLPHQITVSLIAGDLFFREQKENIFLGSRTHRSENYENATSRLIIKISMFIGDVKIYNQ